MGRADLNNDPRLFTPVKHGDHIDEIDAQRLALLSGEVTDPRSERIVGYLHEMSSGAGLFAGRRGYQLINLNRSSTGKIPEQRPR
ncbi:MAG: hypothetical protein ACI8W7_003750 [Gammaproteobacteria bacterium]|jgi:hypothetical protein